jgi:hypothetical protein
MNDLGEAHRMTQERMAKLEKDKERVERVREPRKKGRNVWRRRRRFGS